MRIDETLRRALFKDAEDIESAHDLDEIVYYKRDGWRTSAANAHRRKRRYVKQMTNDVARLNENESYLPDDKSGEVC